MQLGMGEIILRLVSSLIVLIVYLRISSVSMLASKTTTDEIGNIVMGALIGGTITVDVNYWIYLATLVLWGALQIGMRALKYRSEWVSELIDGNRIQLVKDGKPVVNSFKKTKLTPEDFLMDLHQHQIDSLTQVQNIWLEPSGEMTIDEKDDTLLSMALISNGEIVEDQLFAIHKDQKWIEEELAKEGYQSIKDVFLAEYFENKILIYPFPGK